MSMKRVTAICATGNDAKLALSELVEASFPSGEVSILRVTGHDLEDVPIVQRTGIPNTLPVGVATGATVGAALFLSGVLPGAGILAVGPIVAALEGLTLGGAAGSLLGVLAGLGWWKVDADIPVQDLERGRLLIGISVLDPRVNDAVAALERAHAEKITVS
jgi:hypothetical protein